MQTQNENLPEEVEKMLSEIEAFTSFDELLFKAREYRKTCHKHFAGNNKKQSIVLNAVLKQLIQIGEDESRMLPASRSALVRHLAWTWHEPRSE